MSSTRTHRQRWYSSQEGDDIRNRRFLLHPPTHPLLPHHQSQHQPYPSALPPQAQYILHPHPPSPIFTEPSSPPLFHQHPISSSSISAHTPPPPPSSTVYSSSPVSTPAAIRQPIPTRLHHQQALLLLQNEQEQQQPDEPELAEDAEQEEEEEDEVENELQLQYEGEKEKRFDFYFSGGKSEVKQEGAVGVSLDDEVDLFGTSESKTRKEEVSVSLMKWDKGKVVEKDPLEVRQSLAQKKALLAQTDNTKEPKVKRFSSPSSQKAQRDLDPSHQPNFLAQDLALGSTLPLNPKTLLPHALAQSNKSARSHPHLPISPIEDIYVIPSDLTKTPTPVLTSTLLPQPQTPTSVFTPFPQTLHLPPTAFSSRSCTTAYLAAERLFSSRDARRRALGLGVDVGGKRSKKMRVVERERLDEGLQRKLGRLLGWRI